MQPGQGFTARPGVATLRRTPGFFVLATPTEAEPPIVMPRLRDFFSSSPPQGEAQESERMK